MLAKFGKTFDSFSSYEEMLEFAQSIEKPQVSEEEIKQLNLEHPGVKERMFTAICRSNINGWQT